VKLGFIGSGPVSQVLGRAYAARGHEVMLSSRNAEKLAEWARETGDNAFVGTFAEAADFGDVVFLSIRNDAVFDAIDIIGAENLQHKIVIDLTNPMDFSEGMPPKFMAEVNGSLGERIQRALPGSKVVKAFNTIGIGVMTDPYFDGQAATHFIAGNDDAAKKVVSSLVSEFGWDVVDVGGIEQAFYLEALAMLWVNYALKTGSWGQAFKLLRR
jgi:NADPH-dependent F420 reductase